MAAIARSVTASDVSIRAQVRKTTNSPVDDEWVGIIARLNPITPNLSASAYSHYEAYLQRNGDLVILNRPGTGMPNIELGRANVGLDVTAEDVLLQFDLFGSTLSARAWRPGTPMPGVAQVRDTSVGVFRFIHVADTSIPEPSTLFMVILGGITATICRRCRRRC
jgi:hypothetical protein